jgi:hypothetical protein
MGNLVLIFYTCLTLARPYFEPRVVTFVIDHCDILHPHFVFSFVALWCNQSDDNTNKDLAIYMVVNDIWNWKILKDPSICLAIYSNHV